MNSFPKTPDTWQAALAALPATPANIPAFFFGHGSPLLAMADSDAIPRGFGASNPQAQLAHFLRDFGPALLAKYSPKAILVVSAHWETYGEQLVSDYGDENPLLMDYYGFPQALYELKFNSRGDSAVTQRVVQLLKEVGISARPSPKSEPRGEDGRGFSGPGLDHGVFVPFRLMFGEDFTDIPIVEMSLDGSLDPEKNWALGEALVKLREEGVLILSGGLTIHNLRDRQSFSESSAQPIYKEFDKAVLEASSVPDNAERKKALMDLTSHKGFRIAHPRSEHFVPIHVAAGAGGQGDAKIVSAIYGATTVAFGL
ncbi:Extradiol aromatic ring-opening dioxygenase [Cristinia sonorae]|uniref:Extradiol aromatic ring-opening dioxygenase n=1 Tax=Cristinia sonorae TaxID=1940300 RepID=A0A8K0UT44_9AGAR|nr:Extradiol aromatic ring-opening dioxygenase [Cristinia sonorae]